MNVLSIVTPSKVVAILKSMHVAYLNKLFRFAFMQYPVLYVSATFIIISSAFEVLAMNAFIPLSESAGGKSLNTNNLLIQIIHFCGLNVYSTKIIFLAFILIFGLRIILNILGEKILLEVTAYKMPSHLMSLGLENVLTNTPISVIESRSSGYYISLSGEEVNRATSLIATVVRFASTMLMIGLYYVTLVFFSPATAIGILFFLIVSGLSSYGVFRKIHQWGYLNVESGRIKNSIFVDALNGVRAIRAFGGEKFVATKFREYLYPHKRRVYLIDFFNFFGKMFPLFLLIMTFGGYILISTKLNNTSFDYAFAVTLLLILLRFFMSLGDSANVFIKIVSEAKAIQDISSITDSPDIADNVTQADIDVEIHNIQVSGITFSHNKTDDVLRDFSATFSAGKTYAVVGESGAGKSTLLDLILKFHVPDCGSVLVDGVDTRNITEKSLREHITMLGQETIIFNDTIRNNITYGLDVTQAEIESASAIACVDEVIESLPNGYDTVLHYRGTNLSGGQRQRIGLARAILRKPDVLILDESTSALDQKTKEKVLQNIFRAFATKIVIIVSHDPEIRSRVNHVVELFPLAKRELIYQESASEEKLPS